MTIDEAIAAYCALLTEARLKRHGKPQERVALTFEAPSKGKRYTRIERVERADGKVIARSVHQFVDRGDGSLWKPAGWKGPTKNFSRGNVYELPPVEQISVF